MPSALLDGGLAAPDVAKTSYTPLPKGKLDAAPERSSSNA